ncbi:MAG: VWA domain-containing protein, partial [Myxococcota bacterium]
MPHQHVSARMTPAGKTSAILLVAGLVAAGAALLSPRGAAPPPLEPLEPTRAIDASGITLSAQFPSTHIAHGLGETHLAVTITAPSDGKRDRPPVNVAVVIDRSGSMSGEKLVHAKRAARHLVGQLRPGDRFAIIAYGSEVGVVFPSTPVSAASRSAAYQAIDSIYDDGGTNLSGGLIAGRDQILHSADPSTVQRIVLISDGLATMGMIEREQLARLAGETAQRAISITTVGVGLDFDE